MAGKEAWTEESEYLVKTIDGIQAEMDDISQRFARGITAADRRSRDNLEQELNQIYRSLMGAKGSPYFARIDFIPHDEDKKNVYIGKTPVTHNGSNFVTDWRAPIASLYYDGSTGHTEYECYDGIIEGVLTLKRLLSIEDSKLLDIEDVFFSDGLIEKDASKSERGDEYLQSGKSEERTTETHKIVLPSSDKMLMNILSASADTHLRNIVATIQSEQNVVIRADMNKNYIVQGAAGSGKTTVALHRVAYLAYTLGDQFRPDNFLILTQGKLLLNYIAEVLPDLGVEHVPQRTFEELVKRITRTSFELDTVESRSRYKSSYDILMDIDDYLQSQGKPNKKNINLLSQYRKFLLYIGHSTEKEDKLKFDDLAPLLYFYLEVIGAKATRVMHVVIDEAQDFSPMQLSVLCRFFRRATFTVFGDLAQGVFLHGIQGSWEDLNQSVWGGSASVLYLKKSYRSTIEVMDAASKELEALPDIPRGEAVLRHGDPVKYLNVVGERGRVLECVKLVNARIKQGYKNIAIILSNDLFANDFSKRLSEELPGITLLFKQDDLYEGGTCLLTAALAKGLEFDAVIVADAERYIKNALGIKLLYVAMTRAMHALDIVKKA
jgi:DNA helicase IV